MSIIIRFPVLSDALKALKPAVTNRHLPILGGVHIAPTGSGVTLSAFDYGTAITVTVPNESADPAPVMVVNHVTLSKVLAAMAKGSTKRVTDQWNVTITNDGHVEVNGYGVPVELLDAADYPDLPAPISDPVSAFTVSTDQFASLAKRVCATASRDDTLPVLTIVKLSTANDTLTMITTDRYRLSVAELVTTSNTAPGTSCVDAKAFSQILPALSGETTSIMFGEDRTQLASGNVTVTLIDPKHGEYPRIGSILDKADANTISVTVPQAKLKAATVRVAALIDATTDIAPLPAELSVNASNGLTVAPVNGSAPGILCDIEGVLPDGWARTHANAMFLRDAVANVTTDDAVIRFNDNPNKPFLVAETGGAFRTVVMPVRVP